MKMIKDEDEKGRNWEKIKIKNEDEDEDDKGYGWDRIKMIKDKYDNKEGWIKIKDKINKG